MRRAPLASFVTTLSLMLFSGAAVGACATGVDGSIGDDDGGGTGDDVVTVDGAPSTTGQDSGTHPPGSEAGGGQDSGQPGEDAASAGDTATATPDTGSATPDTGSTQDTGASQDTGTAQPDTGTTQPDSSAGGGVCPNTAQYFLEAAAAVSSGSPTFCFTGVCAAKTDCCYEQASPGNICVPL